MDKIRLNTYTGILSLFFIVLTGFITSCDEEQDNPMTGRLKILLTDRPFSFDMVADATATITKIELRENRMGDEEEENEEEGSSEVDSPYKVVWEGEEIYHLTDLQNGITEEIAEIDLPAGNYDLVRIYISDASIELMNEQVYDLKVPSAASSGMKVFIDPALVVEGGLSAELLLDFDLSRSLIAKGPMEDLRGFNFKPVIRAVNNSTTGRVEGIITDESTSDPLEDVEVWLEAADTVVTSTMTEADGFYALIGIPAGTFSLFAEKEGYEPIQVDEVEVVAGNRTTLDAALTPAE